MTEECTIYVFVEGQTEELFVKQMLRPYLTERFDHMSITPIQIDTLRNGVTTRKGGVSNYASFRRELMLICKEHPRSNVTIMFDLYGFPQMDGVSNPDRCDVDVLEDRIGRNIGSDNLIPYLMKHEFEALLFSDVECLHEDSAVRKKLNGILRRFNEAPESINTDASPSCRLIEVFSNNGYRYSKTRMGLIVAKNIGIPRMREKCPHFDQWVSRLESICEESRQRLSSLEFTH